MSYDEMRCSRLKAIIVLELHMRFYSELRNIRLIILFFSQATRFSDCRVTVKASNMVQSRGSLLRHQTPDSIGDFYLLKHKILKKHFEKPAPHLTHYVIIDEQFTVTKGCATA